MTDATIEPSTGARDDADVAPGRRAAFVTWLKDRDRTELLIWLGIIALAIILRVWDLGARPFHHDESQDAYFSYTFRKDFGSYEYNPLLHGPVRFYLTALNFKLFGDSNFTARLAPAYMGTLLVALPYALRHHMGRIAAISAGVMLAVSPTVLYFSRFAREDIYLVAVTLVIYVLAFRFVRKPRTVTLAALFAMIAVSFGVKESGIVSVGFVGGFFVLAICAQGYQATKRGLKFTDGEVMRAITAVGITGWITALAAMLFTYSALFTVFFTHTHCMTTAYAGHPAHSTNCLNGFFYGLGYWQGQQKVARGGDSAWLYFTILFGEEWPILLLGAVGAFFAFLRPTLFRLFLVWMFVLTLAFYCWGSERFAWLAIHPLMPLVLLAGIGLQSLWELRAKVARTAALVAVGLGALYLVAASYSANAKQGANPRSLLVSTQSSVQVKQVADEVQKLVAAQKKAGKPTLGITIDSSQGATFPYAWYFRHDQVGYIDMTTQGYVPNTQVLIMTEQARDALKPNLSAYAGRPFDFRVWWVKGPTDKHGTVIYKKKFSVKAWWNWFTRRKPWSATGGMKEWLYVRRDVGPVPGVGTKSQIPPPA